MLRFETEQKVCEVGGVKFGGQPGDYPTVIVPSIFQKGDKVFEGGRKEGFNRERATELVKMCDKLCVETASRTWQTSWQRKARSFRGT